MTEKVDCVNYQTFGGPDVLKVGKREIAEPENGQVQILVHWAGVNRADLMQRLGKYPNQKKPMNLGQFWNFTQKVLKFWVPAS